MNQRRWIGAALSAAWLAGVLGYEIATWRTAQSEANAAVTPLCQQTDNAIRAQCAWTLAGFYARLSTHHAVEIAGLAALACGLGWLAGLLVIKRPSVGRHS